MLRVKLAETSPLPTKAYADACWHNNPAISPDYWHELLGFTVGKLALDWREAVGAEASLSNGINLVLTSPVTHAQAAVAVQRQLNPPEAAVLVCVTPTPQTLPQPVPAFVLWQVETPPTPEQAHAALVALETATRHGHIQGYGLADAFQAEAHPPVPLQQWLQWAEKAAEQVHGRRKRPGLRLLAVEMDLLNLTALSHPTAEHKGQPVSALEFAARLDWGVIALPLAVPETSPLSPQALQVLTHTAHVEHQLNQQLGGWPMVEGQPLFNVLQHLGQGEAPWPTPHHWRAWQRHVWPAVQQRWQQLQQGLPDALCQVVVSYCHQLQTLQQYGLALSEAPAQVALRQVLDHIAPHFPVEWRMARPRDQVLGLLASVPGVSAVAVPPAAAQASLNTLQTLPMFADLGAILAGV